MALRTAVAAILLFVACRGQMPAVVLATTTSVANSGLLEHVLRECPLQPTRALQVGSGRAVAMLATGQVDAIISHAPEREAEALRSQPTWFYRKILYNDFLIVGPPDDPAGIAGLRDAVEAFKRIAQTGQRFLSRGDESGTHERERQLWTAAGIAPNPKQVIVAGAGMAQTLRTASETKSYTLTDRGTFEMLASSLGSRELVSGDERLLNTYAVIADANNDRGIRFARWLAEGDGRGVLSRVLSTGTVKGFTLWPTDHDGTRPEARPLR